MAHDPLSRWELSRWEWEGGAPTRLDWPDSGGCGSEVDEGGADVEDHRDRGGPLPHSELAGRQGREPQMRSRRASDRVLPS
jgi:hypothetical protein